MQRIALGIEYQGGNYAGWQRQHHRRSVQHELEKALAKVACHPISVYCAGRTDAGVHASGQVVHFETNAFRPEVAWVRGVNNVLPRDIRVCWSKSVDSHFDARKSAIFRRYCFVIANRSVSPGIMHQSMTWVFAPLDESLMQAGAEYLLGYHDFSSFRAAQCQAKTPYRTLHSLKILRLGEMLILDITANAFLQHMVRNIAGTLILVGQKKAPPHWVKTVLDAKDRRLAGPTASPQGLYLVEVHYPEHFAIPVNAQPLWFMHSR